MRAPRVMIAVSDPGVLSSVRLAVARSGVEIVESTGGAGVLKSLDVSPSDLIVIAPPRTESWAWLETAREVRQRNAGIPIILITLDSSEHLAVAALKSGISDYFSSAPTVGDMSASVDRLLAATPRRRTSTSGRPEPADGSCLVGASPQIREIKAYVGKVAPTDSNVLITGETGTGKELIAQMIHRQSPRGDRALVSINCAAIPEALLESELFGYERGAFTGAQALKEGKLKAASGGSAFFDEIGDMSAHAQAKILRALESREIQRLGGTRSVPLDVRVIAATNQELERLIAEQKFRSDLYFRLNVARIQLPPLRERKEDIPLLLDHYLADMNRRFGRDVDGFTEEAIALLLEYDWPGNVRELKNLLEAVFLNLPPRRISAVDLPPSFRKHLRETTGLPQDERARLLAALYATNWNKSLTAEKLQWSRMTVYRKMAKYHLVASGQAHPAR